MIAWLDPGIIAGSPAMAYAFAVAVSAASMATLILFAKSAFRRSVTIGGLVVQALLLILNFAAIHNAFGMKTPQQDGVHPVSFASALYFSVVTWTTPGCGDYTPAEPLQLLAALEPMIGYVYLGLIVGLAASSFDRER